MNLQDYIANDFKALKKETSLVEVADFFKELPFSNFPIVENGKLVGMIAQEDIIQNTKEENTLKDLQFYFQTYKTKIQDSCIDLISLFAQHETDIIPVIDKNDGYLGYFELSDILNVFYSTSPFFSNNNTTIVIEKDKTNYSMSEITQIIESNNSTLLGLYISRIEGQNIQISLRIDSEEVNEIIQSLRRYEYKVLTKNKDDLLIEKFKNRADYLEKYLSI